MCLSICVSKYLRVYHVITWIHSYLVTWIRGYPVLLIPLRRSTRFSTGGWVENRENKLFPEKGLTINMWLVAGLDAIGTLLEAAVSFSSADARLSGFPAILAPV